jgi:hypothetical protein
MSAPSESAVGTMPVIGSNLAGDPTQMPQGLGLFKWRIEERPDGRWAAVGEIVRE